jgi:lipopolysaccharide transport protein LptA/LPS export ABC transporter protein LptC
MNAVKISKYLRIVKFVKYFCVIIAALAFIIISYYIFLNQNNKIRQDTSKNITTEEEDQVQTQITLPNLTGISLKNGPYYIQAREMYEHTQYVSFVNPELTMMLDQLDWLHISSNSAKLNKDDSHLELFDHVQGDLNRHYYFLSNQAEIFKNHSIIRSDNHSKIFTSEYDVESDSGFIMNYQEETAFLHGKINANIKRVNDQFKTNIKSNKLDVFWLEKAGHFIGNVILTRNKTTVTADKMIAFFNKHGNELDKVLAYGNVTIIDEENNATGEYGEYDVLTDKLTLKNNVKLYKNNIEMFGHVLHYNFNTQKADLVGQNTQQKNGARTRVVITPKKGS